MSWRAAMVCVAASFCVPSFSLAARIWSDGLAQVYSDGTNSMPYRLYLPENYDPGTNYPLVLFLHGAGERGSNNISQVNVHISGLIALTFSDYPAILVAPQLPTSSPGGWSPTNPQDLTPGILDTVMNDYSVDANRLYVTGLSMGGFGSFDYLDYYTDGTGLEFAAAVSMHGGHTFFPDPAAVEHFNHVPIWLIHGNNDTVVDVQWSRNTFRSLTGLEETDPLVFNETHLGYPTAVSGDIRYSEIHGGGHGGWTGLYSRTALYDWMFAQVVPEPSAIALASCGLIALAITCWRRTESKRKAGK